MIYTLSGARFSAAEPIMSLGIAAIFIQEVVMGLLQLQNLTLSLLCRLLFATQFSKLFSSYSL